MEAIDPIANLQEYFYSCVREAMAHQSVEASPETEYYLVQLLNRCRNTEYLHCKLDPHAEEAALCQILARALDSEKSARILLLQKLGDIALYSAGYFPESLSRKLIDVDYYMQLGGTAYSSLANLLSHRFQQELYAELSEKFPVWVDILSEVSTQSRGHSHDDLLKLYDAWLKHGKRSALLLLQHHGILPTDSSNKSH